MNRHLLVLLAVVLFSSRHACANFTVFVGNGDPFVFDVLDGTGTLPVFAYNADTENAINLGGYQLAFDIASGDANFTDFSADFTDGIFPGGTSGPLNTETPGASFVVGRDSASGTVPMPTSQGAALKLFDLTFNISPSTAEGTYSFTFLPNLTVFGFPVNAISGTGDGLDNSFAVFSGSNFNQFEISAIPEPTSLLLVACAGGAVALKLRRRRVKSAVAVPATAA